MKLRTIGLYIASALLLRVSFPLFNISWCAFIAFVPLLIALQKASRRQAFWYSYLCGYLFFILTLYWLVHVTLVGLIILCFYLALYFAFFGYIASAILRRMPDGDFSTIIFLSAVWAILEFIRGELLTGFPWALLGYSQYANTYFIQCADVIGSFGLSFLVMFINVSIYALLQSWQAKKTNSVLKVACGLVALITIIYAYGYYSVGRYAVKGQQLLRVSVVQGNIPQHRKWDRYASGSIKNTYAMLTHLSRADNPELIIWPETSHPDHVAAGDAESLRQPKELVQETGRPLLFGAIYQEGEAYFNTAILLPADSSPETVYRKIHRVPFGEFLPLRNALFFLERFIPIADFTAGKESVIFSTPAQGAEARFGVVICFEDIIAELSRQLRLRGADFLVNITNDAWFQQTASPYQHLQASVLRAVENRVYVVRAANTGISCIIDSCGRIIRRVADDAGRDSFVSGFVTGDITRQDALSLYTRYGDVFVVLCLIFTLGFAIHTRKKAIAIANERSLR